MDLTMLAVEALVVGALVMDIPDMMNIPGLVVHLTSREISLLPLLIPLLILPLLILPLLILPLLIRRTPTIHHPMIVIHCYFLISLIFLISWVAVVSRLSAIVLLLVLLVSYNVPERVGIAMMLWLWSSL